MTACSESRKGPSPPDGGKKPFMKPLPAAPPKRPARGRDQNGGGGGPDVAGTVKMLDASLSASEAPTAVT